MDVAVNSHGFCMAVQHVREVFEHQETVVGDLIGRSWLFQLAGLSGICASGVSTTFLLSTHVAIFRDPAGGHFVQDPVFLCAVSAIVCSIVTWPFMLCFGHVADTVLYCFAIETRRHREFSAPRKKDPDQTQNGHVSMRGERDLAMRPGDDREGLLANLANACTSGRSKTSRYIEEHPPRTQVLLRRALITEL